MKAAKRCKICKGLFVSDKWHPHQRICFNPICRRKSLTLALRKWRERYPEYFKNRTDNIESMREWRKAHPSYYREYRLAHPEIKEKTRQYTQAYRARKREILRGLL